jgi:hypothetical protein
MANARIDVSVKEALGRKDSERKTLFLKAKDRFERYALASGCHVIGRTEDGKPAKTRSSSSLGITIDNWRVRMEFKRDDAKTLKNKDWREVEDEARAGAVPTRLVVTENHIITAVRELKHVRKGYSAEIDATRTLVARIITLNMSLANKPHPVSDADISAVVVELRELRPVIASKDSPLKHIVGLGRLDEAIRRFELVSNSPPGKRPMELGRACAVLTSVPERLTAWRDKRIAGGVAYTSLRETALRVERDRWVFSQLARFSSSIKRLREFVDEDEKKKEVLQRVGGMLDELDSLHGPLKRLRKGEKWSAEDESKLAAAKKTRDGMKSGTLYLPGYDPDARGQLRRTIRQLEGKRNLAVENAGKLESTEKAFRTKKREAMGCLWANAGLFIGISGEKKPTHLYGDYGWLHRHIYQERIAETRTRLNNMILSLDSDNPRFILDQLSHSPDSYLAPALAEMKTAVQAFEAKDLRTAQRHFGLAAFEMRKIVFPDPG